MTDLSETVDKTPDTPSTEALTPERCPVCGEAPSQLIQHVIDRHRYSAHRVLTVRQEAADSAWLIERGQPERQTPTVWWTGHDWTEDANKATRYASQDDAEARIASDFTPPPSRGGPSARAVEHRWLDTSYHARRVARRRQEAADTSAAYDDLMRYFGEVSMGGPLHHGTEQWDRLSREVRRIVASLARQEAADTSGPREALERLASWDEMAGNGDPQEFPEPYRAEVRARINTARAALRGATERPLPDGFFICKLCGDPERVEDAIGDVCLTCADAITFGQHARRASVRVPNG